MKLFTAEQIHALDRYTIEHEPISSIDLMERAATTITEEITMRWPTDTPIAVFAGPGNNGGDALAVARMLCGLGYSVHVYFFNVTGKLSDDCRANRERLSQQHPTVLTEVTKEFDPPQLSDDTLVIDGLFGSGLNKPLTGGFASVVKYINQSQATVVSIDLPSGLMAEDNTYNVKQHIIEADYTFTLGQRKICMFMADNQQYLGEIHTLDIGLSEEYIARTHSQFTTIDEPQLLSMLRPRSEFAHKGSMGHALLVAGSRGMAGAATLAGRACLRSGAGKVTIHTPLCNADILQISVPEAVLHLDPDASAFMEATEPNMFSAMGIGPGMGQAEGTAVAMMTQIRGSQMPIVIDADALNILSYHRTWLQQLPEDVILTPHPKEMDRLLGAPSANAFERLMKTCEMAQHLHIYIILKGHYSALCLPNGDIVFNTTGNAGMATAGAGDVLTGIVTGLLARGYERQEAAMLGMYLHGLAGDLAVKDIGQESLIASDIIAYLPKAFRALGMP